MKISYNWLKDYIEIKLPAQKLAQALTMAGLEVTSLEEKAGDWILEIEITSNRPDWLSIIGVAREVAAITDSKIKLPKIFQLRTPNSKLRTIKIELKDKKGCQQYVGILIKDVEVKESPKWLKERIESIGLRPVNNVVDVTNFCLMETGQPLHAFDFDKLSGAKIIVRRARQGETIKTIDQQERILSSEILVIADSQNPVAIAGVMGGLNSEVTFKTRNILLESAYFNPLLIRRASRLLGITTDASYRFERSVDRENVLPAAFRAAKLIQELSGGGAVSIVNQQAKNEAPRSKLRGIKRNSPQQATEYSAKENKTISHNISLKPESVEKLLGKNISSPRIKQILESLQFKVKSGGKAFKVTPPSFRQDILAEADLIEEISRIDGFENLPQTLPQIKVSTLKKQPQRILNDLARSFFTGAGFSEIISYSLICRDLLSKTNLAPDNLIAIKNPLSKEQEVLTPSLIPGLLNAVKNNLNQNIRDLKLFEIGKKYLGQAEDYCLGLVMCGEKNNDWLRGSQKRVGFFDLKGSLEAFLEAAGVSNFDFFASGLPCFNQGAILEVAGEEAGVLGEVADAVLDKWDIKQRGIFLAEINLERLLKFMNLEKKFTALNIFPSIRRDISLVIKEDAPAHKIFTIAREMGSELLRDINLVDLYSGGQIPPGFKGLTLSLEFQAKDRTLTDNEVNLALEKISRTFIDRLGAKIR